MESGYLPGKKHMEKFLADLGGALHKNIQSGILDDLKMGLLDGEGE